MAGFIAAGVVRGDTRVAHVADLAGATLLDVRTREEFDHGHIPSATNLPLDELRDHLGEINRQNQIIAYCQYGQRGYLATRILMQAGYDAANLSGGYLTYCQTMDAAKAPPNGQFRHSRQQISGTLRAY